MSRDAGSTELLSLIVNGEAKDVLAPMTILTLLGSLQIPVDGVAVEPNRVVIPRAQHAKTELSSGDQLEIVTFVGGG